MGEHILEIVALTKRFGGLVATNNLSLSVLKGETHALIGPNGAGKTTLISQLQGDMRPDAGTIRFEGVDITAEPPFRRARRGIARSFQITSVFLKFSVLANVVMAVQAQSGHSFRFWGAALNDRALFDAAMSAIETMGLASRSYVLAEDLSHGERRQLELAMVLAMRPTMLLLDEPMAGMGSQDGARVASILKALKNEYTIVLIEHDMDVVFSLADRVSVLVAGQTIATGTPVEIRSNEAVRASYLGHKD